MHNQPLKIPTEEDALLQKAKKLVAQLVSIKEAKAAVDALAQLLD